MSVSDEDEILIKPQVIPASSPLMQKPHNEAEEKKRRIDEALKHYETTHPAAGAIASNTPMAVSHPIAPTPPLVHKPKKKTPLFTVHANKVLRTKPIKHTVAIAKESAELGIVTPTHIDPDAPIAAAVEAVKQREAERQAMEATEAIKPNSRYHQAVSVDLGVFVSRKFICFGAAWLLAIPVAIVLYHTTSNSAVVANSKILGWLLQAIEYALGAYGAFGWIPLVVFYMRAYKNQ